MAHAERMTLFSAQAANANSQPISMLGYRRLIVAVDVTATIDVNFEGTVNGTDWHTLGMAKMADGTLATASGSTTAKTHWYLPAGVALHSFRVRTSDAAGTPAATVVAYRFVN